MGIKNRQIQTLTKNLSHLANDLIETTNAKDRVKICQNIAFTAELLYRVAMDAEPLNWLERLEILGKSRPE
jgi:hypothetical protein